MPEEGKHTRFPYLLAFILLVLVVNGARSTYDLYKSAGRLDEAKFELTELKTENQELNSQIAYAKTPEYLQKAAIEELNMAKPGETILIVEQLRPETPGEKEAKEVVNLTKPSPLELWATEFGLQNHYFNWQNR